MATSAYLDHIAVAADTWDALWPRYRSELGGEWVSGDDEAGFGFAPAQVRFANNMKVEALMPNEGDNDFLRRFLAQRGPGPHHMTFKVPDIRQKLVEVEAAGYSPVGVYLANPDGWQEAFIHPKQGPGIVIQIAQSPTEWSSPAPATFPETTHVPGATLDYVALQVDDLDKAVALFSGLLDGDIADKGRDELFAFDYVAYRWSSGGVIRLFEGDESGVHHLGFTSARAADLRGATRLPDGRYDVAAADNLGVRLIVSAS